MAPRLKISQNFLISHNYNYTKDTLGRLYIFLLIPILLTVDYTAKWFLCLITYRVSPQSHYWRSVVSLWQIQITCRLYMLVPQTPDVWSLYDRKNISIWPHPVPHPQYLLQSRSLRFRGWQLVRINCIQWIQN